MHWRTIKRRGIVASLSLLVSFSLFAQDPLPSFYDDVPHEVLAGRIVKAMSDEELLAQVCMFGWAGQNPTDLVMQWVYDQGLGSIKIFGWNTKDSVALAKAISLLQKKAKKRRFHIPLFVATDQEGGWVRHVKGLTSETPGNLALGASGIPQDAYYAGYFISKELAALGINMNFAPTVDVLSNQLSTIIGSRSFGDDPAMVSALAEAFMYGSRDAGVLTTAKHFPGHGDTAFDSHGILPSIGIAPELFEKRELAPFKHLVAKGIPAVMTGHLNFPKVMHSDEPATFSQDLLQNRLRGTMGFDGLIITDDIMMHAAIRYASSVAKAVQKALYAGNDIVESSTTPRLSSAFWKENIQAMRHDSHFKLRVKDAAYRVILAKLRYFKGKKSVPLFPSIADIPDTVPNPDSTDYFLSIAAHAVTFVRSKDLPLDKTQAGKILLVSQYQDFLTIGKERLPNAKTASLSQAQLFARQADTIIVCIGDKQSVKALHALYKKFPRKRYIVFATISPVLIKDIPEITSCIALYSYSPYSFIAGFAALLGDFTPTGVMPLKNID